MKRLFHVAALASLALAPLAGGQGDPEVVARIIEEGKTSNQVWDHLMYLSEEIGPRLTGSSNLEEANHWTKEKFESFGLSNVHLQQWGTIPVRFDRGPSYARLVEVDEPGEEGDEPKIDVIRELEFTAPSWSPGTDGVVRGPVFKQPETLEELEAIAGELDGAWILTEGRRRRGGRRGVVPPGSTPEVREQINERLKEAGVLGRVVPSSSELVRTFGQRGWRDLDFEDLADDVTIYIRRSDYDAINSRIFDGEEVILEANLDHTFTEGPIPLYNTIAEIPGTEKPDEVVIISAHLDSWDGPGSLGSQDNGTGTAVTLEAARLLMAAGAKPKRTIRFILWTGEEQGLLGSRAYVEGLSEEERSKISAVFVDDGGTNYEGGLVCIEPMADMLRKATMPINYAFPEMPVEIAVRSRMPRGGGSDHASFNRAGIPGFFWMEKGSGGREGKNYRYIHHTQHDTPRYAVPEYLVQSSTCSAVTAYNLACAETLLPRQSDEPEVASAQEVEPEQPEKPWNTVEGPVTGTWNAEFEGDQGERNFTLVLEMADDGRVRGTSRSEMGEGKVTKGRYDEETDKLTFVLQMSFGNLDFEATVDGDAMKGTLGMQGQFSADWSAKRQVRGTETGTEEESGR